MFDQALIWCGLLLLTFPVALYCQADLGILHIAYSFL